MVDVDAAATMLLLLKPQPPTTQPPTSQLKRKLLEQKIYDDDDDDDAPPTYPVDLNAAQGFQLMCAVPVFRYNGEWVIIAELLLQANADGMPVSGEVTKRTLHNRRQNAIQSLRPPTAHGTKRSRQMSVGKGYSLKKAFPRAPAQAGSDGFYPVEDRTSGQIAYYQYRHGNRSYKIPPRSSEKGFRVCLWALEYVDPRFKKCFFKSTVKLL